jgi:hypothetical protein
MVFVRTRLDYIVTILVLTMFLIAFFFLSDTTGMYQQSYTKRYYIVNDFVIIGPIVLIYEMFQLFILPGKRRGRELPWRLYTQIAKETIIGKIKSGIKEYETWRKK